MFNKSEMTHIYMHICSEDNPCLCMKECWLLQLEPCLCVYYVLQHHSSFIKQTSVEEIHTDGFISCCYQLSSDLFFPNKLIQKPEKYLPQAFIIESNILNQIQFPSVICKEKIKKQHHRMISSYHKCWPNTYFHSLAFFSAVLHSFNKVLLPSCQRSSQNAG